MSIITIIYLAIALLVFVSTLYNMIFKEERLVDQINAAMILIPLLLRIFLRYCRYELLYQAPFQGRHRDWSECDRGI